MLAATSIVVFRDGLLLTLLRQLPFYFGPFLLVLLFARLNTPKVRAEPQGAAQAGEAPADRRRALAARAAPERQSRGA